MDSVKITKRNLLKYSLIASTPVAFSGCGKSLLCFDSEIMSTGEAFVRSSREYVEVSKVADKNCANCSLYTADSAEACGACQIDNLPANPEGYCNSWSQ